MKRNDTFCLNISEIKEVIIDDVRFNGRSDGWLLDNESHNLLKHALRKHDIDYKYLGVWGSIEEKTA